jgi:beta-phosphoglucomutase-like phosphatase (HAD superfamily)
LVIFDCNGVLVDSEPIAAAVLADAFKRIGIVLPAETVMRRFQGRRPSDILAAVEAATDQELPPQFPGESRPRRCAAWARSCAPLRMPRMR